MNMRMNYRKASPATLQAMMTLEQHTSGRIEDKVLVELIKIRVSQINGCAFCVDMHAKDLMKMGDYWNHIVLLSVWREAPLFTQEQRAALELAEAVTLISENGVSDDVFERVREQFGEIGVIDLVMVINTINNWNRIAITTGMFPGCLD